MSFSRIDMSEVIRRCENGKSPHWFKEESLRVFLTLVPKKAILDRNGAAWFASSERVAKGYRKFSMRAVTPEGAVVTIGDFMGFNFQCTANREIKKLVAAINLEATHGK